MKKDVWGSLLCELDKMNSHEIVYFAHMNLDMFYVTHWSAGVKKKSESVIIAEACFWSFWGQNINSLAPGRSECDSKNVIFNLVLLIGIFWCSHDNALRWMPQDLTDDQSTLVQVMAWCHQATSHYLNQCWPRSLPPYGVTRPQWVKGIYFRGRRFTDWLSIDIKWVCSSVHAYIIYVWWNVIFVSDRNRNTCSYKEIWISCISQAVIFN